MMVRGQNIYLVVPRTSEAADDICARYVMDGRARIIVFNESKAPWADRFERKPIMYYISIPAGAIAENGWEDDLKYQFGKMKYHVDPDERFIPAKGWLFEVKGDKK